MTREKWRGLLNDQRSQVRLDWSIHPPSEKMIETSHFNPITFPDKFCALTIAATGSALTRGYGASHVMSRG